MVDAESKVPLDFLIVLHFDAQGVVIFNYYFFFLNIRLPCIFLCWNRP